PDLTHSPDILIPGILEPGRPSTLTCSVPWACERGTPPIFSWVGASVSHLGPTITSSPVLTLTPRPQDHGTTLTCQVTLPAVNVTKRTTMHLNISYSPQNLTVTVIAQGASSAPTALANGSSLPVAEGQALRLLCAVDSHPPARLTWTWGNLVLCPSEPANPGLLELSPEHLRGGGEVTCRAQNSLGSQHVSLSLSLQRKQEESRSSGSHKEWEEEWGGLSAVNQCNTSHLSADKGGLPQKGTGVAGVTLGAIAGAGATTLFFLSFSIILVM
ncbi:sialic acid-binding Ig-like lectin 8, partial [Erethizon dorsatum]